MNGNVELLNFIFQNSQMGAETLSQLLDIAHDDEFKKHLNRQLEGYQEINKLARELLNEHGYDEKGIGAFEKIKAYLMLNMQTMTDKSASHIAEMIIIGSNMGITDAIKNLNRYQDADKKIRSLMEKLQKFEENNVERLKEFL